MAVLKSRKKLNNKKPWARSHAVIMKTPSFVLSKSLYLKKKKNAITKLSGFLEVYSL